MFELAQRAPWRRKSPAIFLPSTSKLCDDKQTRGYVVNQGQHRLKTEWFFVVVRISSSLDMLPGLFQAGLAWGRVRRKEAAGHQLKLSCQQATTSLRLQIHHYFWTGTSRGWSRWHSCWLCSCHWPHYWHLGSHGCFTWWIRWGKQPGWKPAHCKQGDDRSFFSQICFLSIACSRYKNKLLKKPS